jgi:hypothetical protein
VGNLTMNWIQSERCHAIISLPTMPALSATPSGGGALLG